MDAIITLIFFNIPHWFIIKIIISNSVIVFFLIRLDFLFDFIFGEFLLVVFINIFIIYSIVVKIFYSLLMFKKHDWFVLKPIVLQHNSIIHIFKQLRIIKLLSSLFKSFTFQFLNTICTRCQSVHKH